MANGDCPVGARNGTRLDTLEKMMSEVRTEQKLTHDCLQTIIADERLRNSGWARWEKLLLALLTTVGAPVVLLIITWLLARSGAPVVQAAAAATDALTQ